MPATPEIPDRTYHPLDPRNMMDVTPMQRLSVAGLTTYESGYWSDFKQTVGIMPVGISREEAIIRKENAAGDFLSRNIAGTLAGVRAALMIGSYVAGTTVTGGVGGILVGSAIDITMGGLWKASGLGRLQEHFETKAFAENIGQILAKGTGATLSGHGFTGEDIREFQSFTQDAASRFDVDIKDIQEDIVKYVNEGLLKNTHNIEEFKRQFGQLKKNVKEIVETLGTTQDEAVTLMSELNQRGISGVAVSTGISTAKFMSRRTGLPVSTFIGSGMQMAEAFQGTGMTAGAGFQLGMTNRAAIEAGMISGRIPSASVWQLGGAENAAFAMTQQQVEFLNDPLANILLRGAMTPSGELDKLAFQQLASGSLTTQLGAAYKNMQELGYLTYIGNEDRIKSQVLEQGSDVINTKWMQSIIMSAQMSGYDTNKMNLTQLKGFAMASTGVSGAMFDSMAGSLLSAMPPGGTPAQRELDRRSRQEKTREFQREAGTWRSFGRDVGYEFGRVISTITEPFDRLSYNILTGIDNTIETFSDYYRYRTQGVIDYEITREDTKTMLGAIAGGRTAALSRAKFDSGVYKDFSRVVDTGEMIVAILDKNLVDADEVGAGTLRDIYEENRARFGDKYKPFANPEEIIKQLQSLPEFKNALFAQDMNFGMRGTAITSWYAIEDGDRFKAEVDRINQVAQLAKTWGKAPEKRGEMLKKGAPISITTTEIKEGLEKLSEDRINTFQSLESPRERLSLLAEAVGTTIDKLIESGDPARGISTLVGIAKMKGFGIDIDQLKVVLPWIDVEVLPESQFKAIQLSVEGISADPIEIQKRLSQLSKGEIAKLKKLSSDADVQFNLLIKYAGYTNEEILSSGKAQLVVSNILTVAETLDLTVDVKKLTEIGLGFDVEYFKKELGQRKINLDTFVDAVDKGVVDSGWFDAGMKGETKDYLKTDEAQRLLAEWTEAHGKGEGDKAFRLQYELIAAAPSGTVGDLSEMFKDTGDLYDITNKRYILQEGEDVTEYEKEAIVRVMPAAFERALAGFKEMPGELGRLYAEVRGKRGEFAELMAGRGAVSMEALLLGLPSTAAIAAEWAEDGLSEREKRKLTGELFWGGTERDRLIAFGTMDRVDFEKLDDDLKERARETVRGRMRDLEYAEKEIVKLQDPELRMFALVAAGKVEERQYIPGGDITQAITSEQGLLNTSLTMTLQAMTSTLQLMYDRLKPN